MATIKNGNDVFALGAFDETAELKCFEIGRPEAGPNEVEIDIQYCGMCHSDLHACNGDWQIGAYPIAPGHEIAGIVKAVGSNVTQFKVGENVGVGCMVMSCKDCDMCQAGLEQHCPSMVQTYGSKYPVGKTAGYHTNGGYTSAITVDEHFIFQIPDSMKMEYAGVLLCAGITVFSPLNRNVLQKGGGKGKHIAILGFGGLGQMAVKIAQAMRVDSVTVMSRSESKKTDAQRLGAEYLAYTNEEELTKSARKFDVVLDTVSVEHDIASLIRVLKVGGTWVLLGAVTKPFSVSAFKLLSSRYTIEGSLIGGIAETQEMLDFCAKHNIAPEYEVVNAKEADKHFKAMADGKAGARRNVIDIKTLKAFAESSKNPQ